ncbi:MAG: glycosyltransferase [bacterium]|nr:glycosyltransferase [bacterium]
MTVLLILFLGIATLLWLSVFGYLLLLASIASRRRHGERGEPTRPEIAVVIPTLNDEYLILPMLAHLRRTDYPHDRMTVVVVDGGSVDRTTELVRQEIVRGEEIQLVCLSSTRGWLDQINYVLDRIPQDIIVVVKADSILEPSCIERLVNTLENDPHTGVVGANIQPDSALLEERIHWRFLNYLWWLEGEVLSSACVSGVCYAFRREMALPLAQDAQADDIHVALAASARGYRVRICREAHATEVRVPQSPGEFVDYRRRRGTGYLSELRCSSLYAHAPVRWRIAYLIRLWHFLVTPKLGVGLAAAACALLLTPHWPWPLLALAAFAAPAFAALFASTTLAGDLNRGWRLTQGASRWLALTWVSLLTLNPHPSVQGPIGGRP